MNKFLSTITFALALSSSVSAQQQWIDVTDAFVQNPRYDNNSYAGWYGTSLGGYNPKENAEHYEKTYNTYQELAGLQPKTKYRVSLNAFYRFGNATQDYNTFKAGDYAENQYARLYAETSEGSFDTGIALLGSGAVSSSLGGNTNSVGGGGWWGGGLYVPDNMEAAYHWFEAGHYENSLEFTTGSDGTAIIGIKKSTWVSQDWTCIDNWKLEYYGNIVAVTSITLSQSALSMIPTETADLVATAYPANATMRNVTWSSSDTNIATVDATGKITAVGYGTCTITATSVSNNRVKAECKVTVSNQGADPAGLVVNEIQASNIDMFMDPSFNYGSWIELYNKQDRSVMLGGLYITDDPTDLRKFKLPETLGVVPAKGHKTIWFDHNGIWNIGEHNQVNFKLDYDGGTIILSDGNKIILQQDYPEAIARTSYARIVDGALSWAVTASPTPGTSNDGSPFANSQIENPVVDKDAQIYNGTLQVCVNIPSGTTLKYTTDGSTPTETNGEVSSTGIFQVSGNTMVYRFRLFKQGFLPSNVVTRTYIYNDKNFELPIISVVGNQEGLYSDDYGIFVKGSKNGRPGAGQNQNCNWNMDWDRPVNFEYIGADESGEYRMLFNQEVDIARCGGWSRAWTPYSFKLKAAKYYYGQNTMDYQFFPDKPYLKHKTLQIRNGGNDNSPRIKDAALQEIIRRSGLYVDGQCWVPVLHYINGRFMGVINMREPNNKHYAYANYGIDTDEMDQFEMSPDSGYIQMEGTRDAFDHLFELAKSSSDKSVYEEIKTLLDIDEYINYMAVEFYLGANDWPQNNIKGFRDRNDGKFHFVLFDLDSAFGSGSPFSEFKNKQYRWGDRLYGKYWDGTSIEGQSIQCYIPPVDLFVNLMQNDEFKRQFIDHFCVISGSVFLPDRCKEIVDGMADLMAPSMSYSNGYYTSSPWGTANDIKNQLSTSRIQSMVNNMASFTGLNSNSKQSVKLSSNIEGGTITVNDFEIPTGKFNGYLFQPITIKASAPAGYRFCGWTGEAATSENSTELFSTESNWKYYDGGSLDGVSWKAANFNDKGWDSGEAPIGYGKNQHTETEGFLPTYYFRKSFNISTTPTSNAKFLLDFTIDDGMIVYVNGTEAGRYNMPSGNISYNSFASSYAQNNPDTGTMELAASLFNKGENVIAIEVHNNSATSSDILLDARLLMSDTQTNTEGVKYISTEEEFNLPVTGTINLTAVYEPISEDEMLAQGTHPIMVNEVSAANSSYVNDYFKKNDWIELYNTTDRNIDIAGMYISDNQNKPTKYQVPTDDVRLNTIVPAGSHLVVWADKLDNKGEQIHTSFKLSDDGGEVVVTWDNTVSDMHMSLESFADTLHYPAHTSAQTVGRYPDGGSDIYVMTTPTIGKSNQLSIYTTEYVYVPEPEEDPEVNPTPGDDPEITPGDNPEDPTPGEDPEVTPGEDPEDNPTPSEDPEDNPTPGEDPEPIPNGILLAHNGGMSIGFAQGKTINVKSEDSAITSVVIYSTSGTKVLSLTDAARNTGKFASIYVAQLPKGVYLAQALNADGDLCRIKFIIR